VLPRFGIFRARRPANVLGILYLTSCRQHAVYGIDWLDLNELVGHEGSCARGSAGAGSLSAVTACCCIDRSGQQASISSTRSSRRSVYPILFEPVRKLAREREVNRGC